MCTARAQPDRGLLMGGCGCVSL